VALAVVAHVEHGFRNDEAAIAREFLPNHLADHLPIAAVVELRDEVERDHNLAIIGGKDSGRQN
jgi:hypothetical protein